MATGSCQTRIVGSAARDNSSPNPRIDGLTVANKLSGQVTAISESGDAITDISHQQLDGLPRDERVTIECEGHATLGIHPEAHDQPEMTYIAICDPGQTLRLGLVGDSAAKFLGLKVGSQVHVKW